MANDLEGDWREQKEKQKREKERKGSDDPSKAGQGTSIYHNDVGATSWLIIYMFHVLA